MLGSLSVCPSLLQGPGWLLCPGASVCPSVLLQLVTWAQRLCPAGGRRGPAGVEGTTDGHHRVG